MLNRANELWEVESRSRYNANFMLGSCQKLVMAKIYIGRQVLMAAYGCKWSHSFYNLDELQNHTNSNLFLEIFYLLRFLLNDVWTSDIF